MVEAADEQIDRKRKLDDLENEKTETVVDKAEVEEEKKESDVTAEAEKDTEVDAKENTEMTGPMETDAAESTETPTEKEEEKSENPYKSLRYTIVTNDNDPQNMVRLIGLKSLFAKQLPKMPRAYIARLVFDRRHKSLAILSNDEQTKGCDEEIIGAICYRPFFEMRFAEIAFCAVNSSHQVKVSSSCCIHLI